jgi:hypothetical protein
MRLLNMHVKETLDIWLEEPPPWLDLEAIIFEKKLCIIFSMESEYNN